MTKPIRPIRIEDNVAYVTLTQGYEAIIDADDVHLVEGFNWCVLVGKSTIYAQRTTPCDADGKKQSTYMHRAIVAAPPDIEVDHIDGDGLNNRRKSNLRLATKAQNMRNQRIHCDNTSGMKGVSWVKSDKKWQAQIMINGKKKHLGYFNKKELAATAYATASAEMHGEFGRLQ